jgi:hypothetical protein
MCREVADLPLQMANQGITLSPQFGVAQRRMADAICFSGKPFLNSDGVNVTGFLCGYYAQQYAGAHNALRADGFDARARQYLDSIRDPDYARRLYLIACQHSFAHAHTNCVVDSKNQLAGSDRKAP